MSEDNPGKKAEVIVLQALATLVDSGLAPDWLVSVRRAYKREDAQGYDVITTIPGIERAGLQVKSSPSIGPKHAEKYRRNRIPVIFIPKEIILLPLPLPEEVNRRIQLVAINLLESQWRGDFLAQQAVQL